MTAKVLKSGEVVVTHDDAAATGMKLALRQAFAEGLAEGERAATARLAAEIADLRMALATAADTARTELHDAVRLDAETLVGLAADVAAWFLEDVIETDPTVLVASLRGAIAAMADEREIVLHVHPDVADALGPDGPLGVDAVRGDAGLDRGDYRLVADGTAIERRWTEAIATVRPALSAALGSSRATGTGDDNGDDPSWMSSS